MSRKAKQASAKKQPCENPECNRPRSTASALGMCTKCHRLGLEPSPKEQRRMEEEKARLKLRHLIDCAAGKMRPHQPFGG